MSIKNQQHQNHGLSEKSASLSFESWMQAIVYPMSDQNKSLWLKELQEHPEWVNKKNDCQHTPLMRASRGKTKFVKVLIQAGADLNAQDQEG